MLKYNVIESLTESQEYYTQLLDVSIWLPFPIKAYVLAQVWSSNMVSGQSIIYEALAQDDAEISSLLRNVLLTGEKHEVLNLTGRDAQKFMNLIQTVNCNNYLLIPANSDSN